MNDTTRCTNNAAAFVRVEQLLLFARGAGGECLPAPEGAHHLTFERHKGWTLRVTIQRGQKVVGKRLKFYLKTRELAEAEKARELVLATLRRLGLTVKLRHQRKKAPPAELIPVVTRRPWGPPAEPVTRHPDFPAEGKRPEIER